MYWTGKGAPRIYCLLCLRKVRVLGEWAEEPGEKVIQVAGKLDWEKKELPMLSETTVAEEEGIGSTSRGARISKEEKGEKKNSWVGGGKKRRPPSRRT